MRQWNNASQGTDVIIQGDTNLDHLKWLNPDRHLVNMVDMFKDQAETSGFSQIVTGYTRCWYGQSSSLLDQCWTNCATRISSCRNLVRGSSDHNLIEIIIRLKGINKSPKETVKINRKNFNSETFKEMVAGIDWTDILESNDMDISYDLFETKIRNILDHLTPMKKVQISSKHKSWLTDSTRELIVQRDKKGRKPELLGGFQVEGLQNSEE